MGLGLRSLPSPLMMTTPLTRCTPSLKFKRCESNWIKPQLTNSESHLSLVLLSLTLVSCYLIPPPKGTAGTMLSKAIEKKMAKQKNLTSCLALLCLTLLLHRHQHWLNADMSLRSQFQFHWGLSLSLTVVSVSVSHISLSLKQLLESRSQSQSVMSQSDEHINNSDWLWISDYRHTSPPSLPKLPRFRLDLGLNLSGS